MKKLFLLLLLFPFLLKAQQIGITVVGEGTTLFIVKSVNNGITRVDTLKIVATPLPLATVQIINQPDGTWKTNWTVGQTFCLSAVGKDTLGNLLKNTTFNYTSSDTTVAKIVTNIQCSTGQQVNIIKQPN